MASERRGRRGKNAGSKKQDKALPLPGKLKSAAGDLYLSILESSPLENGAAKQALAATAAYAYGELSRLHFLTCSGEITTDESRALGSTGNLLLKTLKALLIAEPPDPEKAAREEFERMMAEEDEDDD